MRACTGSRLLSSLLLALLSLETEGLKAQPLTTETRDESAKKLKPVTAETDYWPMKNGNLARTGASEHTLPFNMSSPAWVFKEPFAPSRGAKNGMPLEHVFVSSPVIDREQNSYLVSTTGWVYSVDNSGVLRWEFDTSSGYIGNPVLDDGRLFVAAANGNIYAIDTLTGRLLWSQKVGAFNSEDVYSLAITGDTLLVPINVDGKYHEEQEEDLRWKVGKKSVKGTEDLVALRTNDGTMRWRFSLVKSMGRLSYNCMPAVHKGTVIFSDVTGGVYCLDLVDGKELWHTVGDNKDSESTGAAVVGSNGLVYTTFNAKTSEGMLRAQDAATGALRWERPFRQEANAGPAVGPVGPNGTLGVAVAIGNNPGPDLNPLHHLERSLGARIPEALIGEVHTFDAETGKPIWSFKTERSVDKAAAGFMIKDQCYPDHWGNPTIGADGVVYVNWSGGKSYALRDENHDGKVDSRNKMEVSSFKHGGGASGATATAADMLVVPSCKIIMGFRKKLHGAEGVGDDPK